MNWNLRLAYLNTFFFGISMGIFQTALAVFITQGLSQSNAILGILFTISGVTSTIFILPSGYLADKYRRDLVIRISVIFGVLAALLLIISTFYVDLPQMALNFLMISEFSAGIAWGFYGPAFMALIADSIKTGNRSKYFASLRFYEELALTIGPFIAVVITIIFGDTWNITLLRIIITLAAICEIISFFIASFMSDKRGISLDSIENSQNTASSNKEKIKPNDHKHNLTVPIIIVTSGLIIGFGAGATMPFFPVLFADPIIGYNLPPSFTYIIIGLGSITTGITAIAAQRIVGKLRNGRVGVMILVQGLAIFCLLGIALNLISYLNNSISFSISVTFLVVLYISRISLMNASGPISRSIIMDVVPKETRAKWNSLEQLAWGMFWSVSAFIGGFVVDKFGFAYVFLFTATLYTLATALLLIIRNKVPKESTM